jgi:hypothetical protein
VFSHPPDPDLAERVWCTYAWPIEYGPGSYRTYFVNQDGTVLFTDEPAYEGWSGPEPDAAFLPGGEEEIVGPVALDARGDDGNIWRRWG